MDSNNVNITVEIIKDLPTIVASVAAIIASIVAIYGINSWRQEFKGKRQIELAEDTLALFYQVRDAITDIRSPFSYAEEGSTRQPAGNETKEQKEARDRAHVAFERFKKHQEVFNKLHSMRYRFMAEIGKDEAAPFEEIRNIINEILISAKMLANLWAEGMWHYKPETQEKHYENIRKHEAIFWWSSPEKDEINKRVNETISAIEKTCKNIITGKSTKEQN